MKKTSEIQIKDEKLLSAIEEPAPVKRWLITEYGREENEYIRQVVVECSDPKALDGESISELLAEDGWELEMPSGIYHDHYDVEGSADEVDYKGLPTIRLE